MSTDKNSLEILCRALESAPAPADWQASSIHPEDVQKWNERYKIWYREIRCRLLDALVKNPKHNIYYSLDRLVQEANAIKQRFDGEAEEKPPSVGPGGIVIGTVTTKKA